MSETIYMTHKDYISKRVPPINILKPAWAEKNIEPIPGLNIPEIPLAVLTESYHRIIYEYRRWKGGDTRSVKRKLLIPNVHRTRCGERLANEHIKVPYEFSFANAGGLVADIPADDEGRVKDFGFLEGKSEINIGGIHFDDCLEKTLKDIHEEFSAMKFNLVPELILCVEQPASYAFSRRYKKDKKEMNYSIRHLNELL